MTLAERRQQVAKDRHERSPMRAYMDAPGRKSKAAPHSRPDDRDRLKRGPAAERSLTAQPLAAAGENPTWVSSWATAYPGLLSIGGQVKLPQRGSAYTGMWLYVLDEAGYPVLQQEIRKATDNPSGDTPATGAWCYDWWSSNSYPTDQCFWWASSGLGGILEDGKKYYAWVFLNSADESSSPGGTTSPLVEAFYTPVIPGAQAGICTCYAQAHRADPVNTATGMFFEQLTDASLVGPGVPLTLERTYRSDSSAVGLLGRGWATPFDARLTVATGKVTYRTDDGASFVFTQASDGTYTAPAGSAAKLVKGTSDYTLTTPDHTKRTFDSGGQLVSIVDTAGKGLSLTYASGRLASVKDAAGRTTTFTSGTNGLLSKVNLPDGTSVSYGYTDGLLTSVTDPAGKRSTYTYGTDKRLSSYTDPAGGKVTNVYDSTGRIRSQTDQNNKTTTFTWDGSSESHTTAPDGGVWTDVYAGNVLMETVDPYGKSITYEYDRRLRPVAITDQRGSTTEMTYDSAGRMLKRSAPSALGYAESWAYDAAGNITGHTDGRGNKTTYTYNTSNQLTSTTDPMGGRTAYTYTALGAIATVTTPRGRTTTYGYDTAGNRTSVTTPLGEKSTFTYDKAGRILSRTDPRGNVSGADPAAYTTSYTYDGRGLLSSATDPLGRTTTYGYNGAEQLTSARNPAGDTTTYAYDDAGHLTRTTDPSGASVVRAYDAGGRLASETDAAGNKTTYTYDKVGRLLSSVSPRGNVSGADPAAHTTSYAYDAAGNRTKVTGPTGASTTTTYDAINRPLVVTDPLGHTTAYTYDANDNVTKVTDAADKTVTSVYDRNNRLTGSTNQLSRTTTYAYDADGNLLSRTSPLGHKESWTYDADGRQATTVDPRGNATGADPAQYTTTYGYDPAGNLTTVTDPLGGVTTTAYDAVNNVVKQTDADQRATAYGYDDLDRLTQVTAPGGAVTIYGYDKNGDVATRTDANGHVTTYAYDTARRLTSVTDPLDRVTAYAYDADGNLTRKTTSRGSISYFYDPRGLTTKTDYSDSTPDVTFGYNEAGQLTARVNSAMSEDFVYDPVGNLTRTRHFAYTYDAAGRMLTRTYSGGSIAYTYDADGRTATMTADDKTTTYTWDPAGNLTRSALPNTETEDRTHDRAGRVTAVTSAKAGTTVTKTALTLSAAGLPTHVDVTRAGVGTGGYDLTYDAAGRLTSGCFPQPGTAGCAAGRTTSYTYDKVGNRLTSTLGTTSTSYTYDAADQLTSTTTGTTTTAYAYDGEGNQTKKGADTYTYDLAGQIFAATVAGTGYTYNHDASGNQVAVAKDGTITNRYQWDPNAPLPLLASESRGLGIAQTYRYDPLGQPESTKAGPSTVFYYHHDTQGSPVDVTDSTGTLHQRWAYDPYGARTLDTTASGAPASTPSYTGARHEPTTGNLDLHARQYDTTTGRFTRPDPATRDQSTPYVSPYAYADNVPTFLTDPSGLTPDDPNDRVDSLGEGLKIFGEGFLQGLKMPFEFLGDAKDAVTGQNGGAGAFVDKYLPVRPAYRLYRAEYMLRQQGCDALADLYAEAADELTQQIAVTGLAGLTGWRRTAVYPEASSADASRSAPGFVAGGDHGVVDVRGIGRPDNELVLSGHGVIRAGDGTAVTVPQGTTLYLYSKHGEPILDVAGNAIENGFMQKSSAREIYKPGETLPDYSLLPPTGLKIEGSPRTVTVQGETRLSDLLRPNMGVVHWAACRSVRC
ncbi:putative adhesin [Streptomyces sp. NPDC057877]|uniref:putative adhesin n=1 Tax=Streptomyces sp. NPDC057877 TaxID=3346269 RepID=UPI0036CA3692